MVRKIECPWCNKVMPYTKLHEHQRQKECMKVAVGQMIEEKLFVPQFYHTLGNRVKKKGLKKHIKKEMKKE